jgi:hypothetical protein
MFWVCRFDPTKRFGGAACGRYGLEVAAGAAFNILNAEH